MKINTIQTSILNRSLDIFVAGCARSPKCRDCHNPALWDFDNGQDITDALVQIEKRIYAAGDLIQAVRVMGGEPAHQRPDALYAFMEALYEAAHGREIWIFTGESFSAFALRHPDVLKFTDWIKTGGYIPDRPCVMFPKSVTGPVGKLVLASDNQSLYKRYSDGCRFEYVKPVCDNGTK